MVSYTGKGPGGGASVSHPLAPERNPGGRSPESRNMVDVLVATYNSGETLEETLESARRFLPIHCLIVVDRASTDGTPEIARRFGARVLEDTVGLGSARNRALRAADTDPVLFLDSDVKVARPDFFSRAAEAFSQPDTAAVVGMALGHTYCYGLPLGLTLIGRSWSLSAGIPNVAQGRETYYLQRLLRQQHRRVRYVMDAMVHHGTYRRAAHWPEFQGASIRRASGLDPRELAYAGVVVLLMHMNSKHPANVLYSPVFCAKIVRGFLDPGRWDRLDRSRGDVNGPRPDVGPRP